MLASGAGQLSVIGEHGIDLSGVALWEERATPLLAFEHLAPVAGKADTSLREYASSEVAGSCHLDEKDEEDGDTVFYGG